MALVTITPPYFEPVSLDLIKQHISYDFGDRDVLINDIALAARESAEGEQNRCYITQILEYTLDAWPARSVIYLPRAPVQSVDSVKYTDCLGAEVELTEGTDYIVDTASEPARICLAYGKSWPTATLRPVAAIKIQFTAGYGDSGDAVPMRAKQAICMLAGHYWENREAVAARGHIPQEMPMGVRALLRYNRMHWSEERNR